MPTVLGFYAKVDKLAHVKQDIANQQFLLHGQEDDFGLLKKLKKFFAPYYELWTRIDEIMKKKSKWADSKLSEIDSEDVNFTI